MIIINKINNNTLTLNSNYKKLKDYYSSDQKNRYHLSTYQLYNKINLNHK